MMLPGRSCSSLAGVYRKYSRIGEDKTLRDIVKKGRYSQYFSSAPGFPNNCSLEKTTSTQVSATNKELSPVPAHFLSEDESIKEEEEEEEDIQEFLLAVDDLESVLSYRDSDVLAYNITTNMKKLNVRNLDDEFTQMEEDYQLNKVGHKRIKISENSELSRPLYDTKELHYH